MADIELIVRIDEKLYKDIYSDAEIMIYGGMRSGKTLLATLLRAIRNSTPLPKGHGRLIDADKTLKAMDSWDKFGYSCHDMFRLTKDSEKDYVSYVHYADMVKAVNNAPTIIEADKGGQNEIDN